MSRFVPSTPKIVETVYGSTESTTSSEEEGSTAALLAEYAPVASSFLFGSDPRVKYEKKKASLVSYTRMYNNAPNRFLKGIYATKIRSLTAEIKALGEQAGEERAAVALTQTGKIGGILLIGAGTMATLMVGNYFFQKSRTEKLQRAQMRR